tara:strand:+ start:20 stop:169 length:150 start_codon:yes stop_codon:yes gene_type:complete
VQRSKEPKSIDRKGVMVRIIFKDMQNNPKKENSTSKERDQKTIWIKISS